jgi:hypothetical protein
MSADAVTDLMDEILRRDSADFRAELSGLDRDFMVKSVSDVQRKGLCTYSLGHASNRIFAILCFLCFHLSSHRCKQGIASGVTDTFFGAIIFDDPTSETSGDDRS